MIPPIAYILCKASHRRDSTFDCTLVLFAGKYMHPPKPPRGGGALVDQLHDEMEHAQYGAGIEHETDICLFGRALKLFAHECSHVEL